MKVAERRKQTQTFHFSSYPVCLPSLWFSGSHKFGKNNIHPLTLHLGIPLFLNIFLMKLTKLLSLLKLNMSEQHITECRNCIRPSLSFLSRFPLESSNALLKMNVLIPDTLQQENTVTPLFFFSEKKTVQPQNTLPGIAFSMPVQTETRSVDTASRAKITNRFRCISTGVWK